MGLHWALCIYVMVVNVFVGFLILGARVVSDSFACSWDLFPPAGLPLLALVWGFMPSLVQSFYAVFGRYPWEDCSFLKGKEEQWRGKWGVGGRSGGREISVLKFRVNISENSYNV